MENKFKVSDKVRCVSERGYMWLTKGYTYEIRSCSDVEVGVVNDDSRIFNYPKFCFEPVIQRPNYMMVWNENEKLAIKANVYADLTNNPIFDGEYPVKTFKGGDATWSFKYCKSIEQWEADNKPKPKYRPFTMEEFDKVGVKLINIHKRRIVIDCYGDKFVTINGEEFTYAELLKAFTLIDGTPCGIKE